MNSTSSACTVRREKHQQTGTIITDVQIDPIRQVHVAGRGRAGIPRRSRYAATPERNRVFRPRVPAADHGRIRVPPGSNAASKTPDGAL